MSLKLSLEEVKTIRAINAADPDSGVDSEGVDRLCETVARLWAENKRLRTVVGLLSPREIPDEERWLWENPDALCRVLLGIREAAEGKLSALNLGGASSGGRVDP